MTISPKTPFAETVTSDDLDLGIDPAEHLRRGTALPSGAALRQARWRARQQGKQLSVMLPVDVMEALSAYLARQSMDAEEPPTMAQVVERIIRNQIMRKR